MFARVRLLARRDGDRKLQVIAEQNLGTVTTRSYRAAFSHDKAMSILHEERGTTVDPELFALFERSVAPRMPEMELDVAPQAIAV